MNIVAIISEYNPLHSGHIYQIKKIKNKFPDARIISIMSGNFVQRGEPAILNKITRTKFAIENGIDLVIQLPTIYSLQSAENFAFGGMKIINALNCVSHISFGVEIEDFTKLYNIAYFQYKNKDELNLLISKYMALGNSYASSYEMALLNLMNIKAEDNLFLSNNILALEYIKSSIKLNMNINFLPIQRKGSNYLCENLIDSKYNSATAIRKNILNGNINSIEDFIPKNIYEFIKKNDEFTSIESFFEILKYNILIHSKDLNNITGFEEGLDNLFGKNILTSKNIYEFINKCTSKRYSKSRIQRLILNYLLNISKDFVDQSIESPVNFIKILGFNKNGQEIIKYIKNTTDINIVTKNKDFKLNNPLDNNIYTLENKATDLYNINSKDYIREMQQKIYIKKEGYK